MSLSSSALDGRALSASRVLHHAHSALSLLDGLWLSALCQHSTVRSSITALRHACHGWATFTAGEAESPLKATRSCFCLGNAIKKSARHESHKIPLVVTFFSPQSNITLKDRVWSYDQIKANISVSLVKLLSSCWVKFISCWLHLRVYFGFENVIDRSAWLFFPKMLS